MRRARGREGRGGGTDRESRQQTHQHALPETRGVFKKKKGKKGKPTKNLGVINAELAAMSALLRETASNDRHQFGIPLNVDRVVETSLEALDDRELNRFARLLWQ